MLHRIDTVEAWLCEKRRRPLFLIMLGAIGLIDLSVTILALAFQ